VFFFCSKEVNFSLWYQSVLLNTTPPLMAPMISNTTTMYTVAGSCTNTSELRARGELGDVMFNFGRFPVRGLDFTWNLDVFSALTKHEAVAFVICTSFTTTVVQRALGHRRGNGALGAAQLFLSTSIAPLTITDVAIQYDTPHTTPILPNDVPDVENSSSADVVTHANGDLRAVPNFSPVLVKVSLIRRLHFFVDGTFERWSGPSRDKISIIFGINTIVPFRPLIVTFQLEPIRTPSKRWFQLNAYLNIRPGGEPLITVNGTLGVERPNNSQYTIQNLRPKPSLLFPESDALQRIFVFFQTQNSDRDATTTFEDLCMRDVE
jgi:hypothetical protein